MDTSLQQYKVLIVEDNSLNMKLFNDLLTIKNCNIVATQDGHQAIDLAKNELPHLILMDIQLNGISGIDLIKELKTLEMTKHIPIIAITAFAMKHDEAKILQAGCDLYLSKPISIEDFFNAVDHALHTYQVENA